MATTQKSDALTTFRAQLAGQLRVLPMVARAGGLEATLQSLDRAMVEQARRQADLAAAVCALERGVKLLAPAGSPPLFTDDTVSKLHAIVAAAKELS